MSSLSFDKKKKILIVLLNFFEKFWTSPDLHSTISSTPKKVTQLPRAFICFTSHWMNPMCVSLLDESGKECVWNEESLCVWERERERREGSLCVSISLISMIKPLVQSCHPNLTTDQPVVRVFFQSKLEAFCHRVNASIHQLLETRNNNYNCPFSSNQCSSER